LAVGIGDGSCDRSWEISYDESKFKKLQSSGGGDGNSNSIILGISVGAAHASNGDSKILISRYQQLTNSNATASSCSISIGECMQVVKATATF